MCGSAVPIGATAAATRSATTDEQITVGTTNKWLRTPMKRFGNLEELIGAAVYLASDASTFVTGQILAVDGGFLASGVNQ